jgi:1-acylglycerone phosphate reductase
MPLIHFLPASVPLGTGHRLFTSLADKIINRMANTRKNILVTGCSAGGLGFALAKAFRDQGFHVLAAVRDANKAGALVEEKDIEILTLDVTSAASIVTCLEQVRSTTGGKLDVIVNNAGVAIFGPLIHASIEEGKAVFDVNVWGPLAVAQAFAPLLIESKGVILNISSIAGAVPLAWQGTYASILFKACYLSPISPF